MRERFTYIGLTPAHGKIFKKGKVEIVIYYNGRKRYWPYGCPGKSWQRDKTGMDFHFHGNWQ
jgi:hypothetical protein